MTLRITCDKHQWMGMNGGSKSSIVCLQRATIQTEWESSWHDISPWGTAESRTPWYSNDIPGIPWKNNANHQNISQSSVNTAISMWPWCVLNLKCRCYDENDLLSAAAGGRRAAMKRVPAKDRFHWMEFYIWRVMFVFNIKINESKQNNKSPQKLNCNDVVFISSSPSYAIQTDIQSIAGAAMSRQGWPGARSR